MPSRQNNQNKTGQSACPTRSTPNVSEKAVPPEIESEPTETAAAPQDLPEADDTSEPLLDQEARDRQREEQVTLMFLSYYHALEHALIRAGFTRAGSTPGSAQPDWIRFARHIEGRFHPDDSKGLKLSVAHLLEDEKNLELRGRRLENYSPLENGGLQHDIDWIAELLQHTRNKLIHGLNFPERPGCDLTQVMAAMFVLEDWSHLDPEVEGLLGNLQ